MMRARWLALLLCVALPWAAAAQPALLEQALPEPAQYAPDYILDADARAAFGEIGSGANPYVRMKGAFVPGLADEPIGKAASRGRFPFVFL